MKKTSVSSLREFLTAFAFILLALTICFASEKDIEKSEVIKEAVSYFEAEVSGDSEAVWRSLAPSSVFKRDYSYDQYLELQAGSNLKVTEYKVLEVVEIMRNNDPTALPGVEKLAAVKVWVRLKSKDGRESEHNNIFMFLKENGKWFKG